MTSLRSRIAYFAVISISAATAQAPLWADGPVIRGNLEIVEGVKLLRVHGDPHDRGFAQGYLLADEIIALIDGYLAAENISGGAARFEAMTAQFRAIMSIPPENLDELRGMLEGIERRRDGATDIARLSRKLKLSDLVAINCIPDAVGFGCSSFAAWGMMTPDGRTVAGRNLDWHTIPALRESQIVVATVPAKDDARAAWLSVTWPGLIGCLTGMNEHGVTVSMHDAFVDPMDMNTKFTPRALVLRKALEAARVGSVKDNILAVLSSNRMLVGNIVPVAMPSLDGASPSLVFEYGGFRQRKNMVDVRDQKSGSDSWQVATNHFRCGDKRASCRRYETLERGLSKDESDTSPVSLERAWALLEDVAMSGNDLVTYQSVVFEPNAKRVHVSFSTATKGAPTGMRVTLNVAELLHRPDSEVAARP